MDLIFDHNSVALSRSVVTLDDWDGVSGTTMREMDILFNNEEVIILRDVASGYVIKMTVRDVEASSLPN